jgi:hypothetical protein
MSGPGRPRRPLIEALEPRMLFSATADIAVFDDGSSDPDYLAQASQSIDLTQIYPHIISAEDSAPDAIAADVPNTKPLDMPTNRSTLFISSQVQMASPELLKRLPITRTLILFT